jgi:predicted acylesterase/phospholipase RssA
MKYLAIGPGSVGYFAYLGCLSKMNDVGMLEDLEEVSGASAGSLIAVMMLYYSFDFKKILKKSLEVEMNLMKPSIKSLITSYGLISKELIKDLIMNVVQDITFAELYDKVPIKLHIPAYCADLNKTHYFSVDSHPNVSIIDVLCMSIAIPFLFSASKFGDWTYMDGGLAETCPCAPYIGKPHTDVLALRLSYDSTYSVKSFGDYALSIVNILFSLRYIYPFNHHYIHVGSMNIYDFTISESQKMKIFLIGYNSVECDMSTLSEDSLHSKSIKIE